MTSPTLVIAGDRDSIIPVEQSRRLYAAIAAEKRLVVIAGADHNDEAMFVGQELLQAVLEFVAGLARSASRDGFGVRSLTSAVTTISGGMLLYYFASHGRPDIVSTPPRDAG